MSGLGLLQRLILFWPLFCGCIVKGGGYPHVKATRGQVWPRPQVQRQGQGSFLIQPRHFQFKVSHAYPQWVKIFKKMYFHPSLLGQFSKKLIFTPFCWVNFQKTHFHPILMGQFLSKKTHFHPYLMSQLSKTYFHPPFHIVGSIFKKL